MDYLLLILVTVAITTWWVKFRSARMPHAETKTTHTETLSHDEIIQLQLDFERRLESESDLPDGIRGKDAYIYWNLMRNWFSKLAAENRYNDEIAKKLQRDWCAYIELLPRMKNARFMALELEDKTKADIYDQEAEQISRSIEAIQDAFAASIGGEAVGELRNIQSRNADAFDRTGKRPMAPPEHHYFPVSISPYIEECQPKHATHEFDKT